MPQPALSGPVLTGPIREDNAEELKKKNAKLQRDVDDLRLDVQRAKNESARALAALANLRNQLNPLYRALRAIFGELETVDLPEVGTASAGVAAAYSAKSDPRWEAWKEKLGGRRAEMIAVLLEHGTMSAAQLAAALHASPDTAYKVAAQLQNAGLISRNAGRFSLKEL
jgi:hypothetical protein